MSEQRNARRTLYGKVIAAKTRQTIVVEVDRTFKHARYGKYMRRKKRYMAHDSESTAQEGDLVEIGATRPISKRKRWRLVQVMKHGDLGLVAQSPDAELAAADAEGGDA